MLSTIEALEQRVLTFVALGDPRDGRPTYWGDFSNQTGNPDTAILLQLLKDLYTRSYLAMHKWVGTTRITYPAVGVSDQDFFLRGDFVVNLTIEGRRRHDALTRQAESEIPILQALELERVRHAVVVEEITKDNTARIAGIPTEHSGTYIERIAAIHMEGLDHEIQDRIAQRRTSIWYVPELATTEHLAVLRAELGRLVDQTFATLTRWLTQRGIVAPKVASATPEWANETLEIKGRIQALLRAIELRKGAE